MSSSSRPRRPKAGYNKGVLAEILKALGLGDIIAEKDDILYKARVETSVFWDLLNDKVDLIPGTKGSGKSALFRMFTDFLTDFLFNRRIIVAHGVYSHGDVVFQAFAEEFDKLTEDQFVDFWCIYLIKIAYTDFVGNSRYASHFSACHAEVNEFKRLCNEANVGGVEKPKSFFELLESVFVALAAFLPTFTVDQAGKLEINPAGNIDKIGQRQANARPNKMLPKYKDKIRTCLDEILKKTSFRLWLMVDRLDELFPRRSELETRALRGLLRCMKEFSSKSIIVKIFLRDDILEQVSRGGFTALTHVTSRRADKLRWSEDQILTLIVKRFCANAELCDLLNIKVNSKDMQNDFDQCKHIFSLLFPDAIMEQRRRVPTIKWLCEHIMDGNDAVTPRDVIELFSKARQFQQDELSKDSEGFSDYIIGERAIRYGYKELSKHKRDTFLQAEYPHLWGIMRKFELGRADYRHDELLSIVGNRQENVIDDLVNIGFLKKKRRADSLWYSVPHVYRSCMDITR